MASFSCFVNFLKSEQAGKQIILIVERPATEKAESLSQPQHGFEARDCSSGRVE
jgi:hypothetical protein